jgi:hypothetical protein
LQKLLRILPAIGGWDEGVHGGKILAFDASGETDAKGGNSVGGFDQFSGVIKTQLYTTEHGLDLFKQRLIQFALRCLQSLGGA